MSEATSQYLNTGTPLGNEIDRLRAENKALRATLEFAADALEEISDYEIPRVSDIAEITADAIRAALNGEEG